MLLPDTVVVPLKVTVRLFALKAPLFTQLPPTLRSPPMLVDRTSAPLIVTFPSAVRGVLAAPKLSVVPAVTSTFCGTPGPLVVLGYHSSLANIGAARRIVLQRGGRAVARRPAGHHVAARFDQQRPADGDQAADAEVHPGADLDGHIRVEVECGESYTSRRPCWCSSPPGCPRRR